MQAIYDHLQAVLLAGVVLLILMAVGQNTLEAMIEGSRFHARRVKQTALISQIQQDFRNVGAGGASQPIVSAQDGEIVVQAPPSRGDSARQIRYEREVDSTASGADTTLYRLKRYVDGSLSMESPPLRGWSVRCLDGGGDTLSYGGTAYKTDTRGFSVTLESQPEDDQTEGLPQRWENVIYPYHLNH